MVWKQYKEEKHESILPSMIQHMEECRGDGESPGYTETDVQRCGEILDEYVDHLAALEDDSDPEEILTYVEKLVISLNELNDECAYRLIETDQRDLICDFIERAAQEAGLETDGSDIAEAWREW